MPYSADALDSRDDDWQIDGFDGQTHFSDDGQMYQPIDPNVDTGNSDALWVPKPGAVTQGTLRGDMPSAFDYLRVPSYAELSHPRIFPAPKVRDLGPVLSFENPYEPFPKGNSPRVPGIRQRLDETLCFSDDAQGLPMALYSDYGDAGAFGSDRLNPGEQLTAGQQIFSPSKKYRLVMQPQGNLVLYNGPTAIWYTNAAGFTGKRAVMQKQGNFVLYDGANKAIWYTSGGGNPGAYLVLQDDGNLVIYHGKNPIWNSQTAGGGLSPGVAEKHGFLGSIGSAIGSVGGAIGKGVASVATGIARPVGSLLTSPIHMASDLAHGKNVFNSIKDSVKRDISSAGDVAPYVQAVLSVVPGVGAGVNAAIAAGSALAHGRNITDALVSATKNMLPGGPLAAQALDTAYQIAKGGNVLASALDAARNQLPGGELAKRAFDTGIALAHGANLQKTVLAQGASLAQSAVPGGLAGQAVAIGSQIAQGGNIADIAKGKAMSFLSDSVAQLSPINTRILSGQGPQFIGDAAKRAMTLVPQQVKNVGQALLANPGLRSLPLADLAQRMNVPVETARHAAASLLASVQKAGGPSLAHMAPAADLAKRLNPGHNFDQLMSAFGSRMAPIAYSPNAMARRARPIAMQWGKNQLGRFIPHISEASGLDSTGTAYLVESGDSMSKIASKLTGASSRVGELIKANPQVKDPNKIFPGQRLNLPASWMTKPAVATQAPPMTTSASPNASPAPLPTFTAPVVPAIVAQSMPTLSEQSKSSGASVIAWQNILIRDGVAKPGTADGFFGPNTTARTKAWQASHGLGADGVVGPKTWSVALATVPAVLSPSALPTATLPPVIQTPLGPVALPPGLAIPASTTISESPVAQPIATNFPTLPALPPPMTVPVAGPGTGLQIPPVGTTIGTTPVVTATQTGPAEVTVTQPPIQNDVASKAPAAAGLGAIALALGALYIVGKGKVGL
jgi:peptidoglycan hydrolase-like protein with peptidoglycan-binding domain/nucleoid-associated protein YgaU